MSEPMTAPLGLARANCEVHGTHRPSIERSPGIYTVEAHHIHPKEFGGPNEPTNMVWVCPTGHSAIHELLRAYVKAEGTPSWSVRRGYSNGERKYAALGYQRIVDSGKIVRAQRAIARKESIGQALSE